MSDMRRFIERLHPLNRSICSPDLDRALDIIKAEFVPDLVIDGYPTGSAAWTWRLPRKWDLRSASIACGGREIVSTATEPLCVSSGSLPVDAVVSYDELRRHVYADATRPALLVWNFRYYGRLDWGFNLPFDLVARLDRDAEYHVRVDARYYDDVFRVGYVRLPGRSPQTILVSSDICHPYQCNDSLSGTAVAHALYEHLKATPRFFTYVFTFLPETIGTIAFLANHPELADDIVYSVYTEFWGRPGRVRLQRSLRGDSLIDEVATQVLTKRFGSDFTALPFREDGIMNDEAVTSSANLWIPSIALNRGPFEDYHSHRDIPARLDWPGITEGFEIVRDIVDGLESLEPAGCARERGGLRLRDRLPARPARADDVVPVPLYTGPIFLSQYGLWVDWREQPELNAAMDLIMACIDGRNSVGEIAAFVRLPFEQVRGWVDRFAREGLVRMAAAA